MLHINLKNCSALLLWLAFAPSLLPAQDVPSSRVLVIGIDGLRPDALRAARTKNLDSLIDQGCFSNTTQILGDRYRENDTVSGPGWSSFLTGVWADKHGVNDNRFGGKNYTRYPHFFALLKQRFPDARTGSFVDWEPIDTHIVTHADVRKAFPATGVESYVEMDAKIADVASEFLSNDDPHATMVYFGAVDESGHRHGFHPSVNEYVSAIETVDKHVGRLLRAVRRRTRYEEENWLMLVSTDHGGRGRGHSDGHDVAEILTTFLIVSGATARRGLIDSATYVVDLPVTALVHLGVDIDPNWKLDGRAVGLK